MNEPLEFVIQKLRQEFELRQQEHGTGLHANFSLQFDIQDGNIVHGILNGIRFRIPKPRNPLQISRSKQLTN